MNQPVNLLVTGMLATAIILAVSAFSLVSHAAQNNPAPLNGGQSIIQTAETSQINQILKLINNVNLRAADQKSNDAVQTILDWKNKIYNGKPVGAEELKAPPATRREAY